MKRKAWHFVAGRSVVVGETVGRASARVLDVLERAPGSWVCRDRVAGKVITVLWTFDATETLRAFARRCALDVAHLWDMPPVVRQYLETDDESLRGDAWDVAWDAAGVVVRDENDVVRDATVWTAARAANAAAWAAARNVNAAARNANDAARAANAAAWNTARDAQNASLERMLLGEAKRLGIVK